MVFSYEAIDANGQKQKGVYNASDRAQVVTYLKSQKLSPISIKSGESPLLASITPKKKPKTKDMSMFCEQFSSLIKAGVSLVDALTLLSAQMAGKKANQMLLNSVETTISAVNAGESLSSGMAKGEAFNPTLVNLVKAGEESGSLETSLDRMATQYKKDAEMEAAIKKAMRYPIIVLTAAIIVVIVLLVYVVPSFMNMFKDIGMEMPAITVAVVNLSNWFIANWYIVLIAVVAIVGASMTFFRSETGKRFVSTASLKIPKVKQLTININTAKIARTLSTLLTSGMPVIEALTVLEGTLGNYHYKQAIREIREDVLTGQPMSRKFVENTELFPNMLSHMISVGEDTGDIPVMLTRTADYYDDEVRNATDALMQALQPATIVFLTVIVGIVLASVLAPMLTLYTNLGDSL